MFSFKTLMDNASSASRWMSGGRKAEPTAPQEVRRIPRRQFDAVMGGAKAAMRDLTEFAKQAKLRLREDRPIKQDDLLDLLRKLIAAQKRIDSEIESTVAKSADMGDTEWDRRSYNLFAFLIAPSESPVIARIAAGAFRSLTRAKFSTDPSDTAQPASLKRRPLGQVCKRF